MIVDVFLRNPPTRKTFLFLIMHNPIKPRKQIPWLY